MCGNEWGMTRLQSEAIRKEEHKDCDDRLELAEVGIKVI